jgi:hypothetical protein
MLVERDSRQRKGFADERSVASAGGDAWLAHDFFRVTTSALPHAS